MDKNYLKVLEDFMIDITPEIREELKNREFSEYRIEAYIKELIKKKLDRK